MGQEFNMAVIDIYEDKLTANNVQFETNVLVEYGTTCFAQLWQIGSLILPISVA